MLQLKKIVKNYTVGDMKVEALKGVSLNFRENEFVSVLGPSGCGKTTLLNIIGGLDRYTSGDLIINGVSTKQYKDVDWDIYRNNSIGFVFQSYNLIPHQTALSNVELAMTLAGISKSERRRRAVEALDKVGLRDQINKKPNQMSGGQMQRVSIARALVNNPDILLADEPTGALDSETSVQIMEILKEIAKDRLVIMVTHNPDLAKEYSTRIIRLLDGRVTDDTNPYDANEKQKDVQKKKKISMSFFTALSLSMNNLMTKKTRTVLTAFAGSIGIIGIALILSLSSGMQGYISKMQEDTLSSYPIQIESQSVDMSSMMSSMMSSNNRDGINHELDKVYSNSIITGMVETMSAQVTNNNLREFKKYVESKDGERLNELTNSIQYGYSIDLQIYNSDTENGVLQVNPSTVFEDIGMNSMGNGSSSGMSSMNGMMGSDTWTELLGNEGLLQSQYDVLAGSWPSAYNEVVLVVDENNEISDLSLYSLGLLDIDEFKEIMEKAMKGEEVEATSAKNANYTYDEILSLTFKLFLNTDYYVKEGDKWIDKSEDDDYMKNLIEKAPEIKVAGIVRPAEEAAATSISGSVGYTSALTKYVIDAIAGTEIVKEQEANPETNVFTGIAFDVDEYVENLTMEDVNEYVATLPESDKAQVEAMFASMTEDQVLTAFANQIKADDNKDTYESNCELLGIVDYDNPSIISFYPKDFTSKEEVSDIIEDYNKMQEDAGHDEYVISYTDIVELMTSSISSIINIITYVLIAFVAISLVVSSIMIAIITYISVLERTKEIGILRSIGASKRDISRVFNAETIIEGLVAGVLGVGITLLLNIPINLVIKSLVGISGIAALPVIGAVALILLSVFLTVIAGFIPSKMAAKKDPVEALRTE